MTPEEEIELKKTLDDALTTGEGFMLDGKRIDPKDIYKDDATLRAEKFGLNEAMTMQIAAEIRAAVDEKEMAILKNCEEHRDEDFIKGRREAYADVAKWLVSIIRAKKAKELK